MTSRSRARAYASAALVALLIGGSSLLAPAAFAEDGRTAATSDGQAAVAAPDAAGEPDASADPGAAGEPDAAEDTGATEESETGGVDANGLPDEEGVFEDVPPSDGADGDGTDGLEEGSSEVIETGSESGADEPGGEAVETTVGLTASAAKLVRGKPLTLTAEVDPASAAGQVRFMDGEGTALGDPVTVDAGKAVLQVSDLAVGTHSLTAVFSPADSESYRSSMSRTAVTVEVTDATKLAVASATLDWAVKDSFLKYVQGPIAHGKVERLGKTTGSFRWTGGTGTAVNDGSKADVQFGSGDGVRFTGHAGALDLRFTNLRVEIASASGGTLYADVRSREFEGMDSVSQKFFEQQGVPLASLKLSSPVGADNTLTWRAAPAVLTAKGAEAFGGFYEAGTELAPITFSLTGDSSVVVAEPTSVKLTASKSRIEQGRRLALRATIAPKGVQGTVTFSTGEQQIGKPVATKNGVAALETKDLAVGAHSITASFVPSDPAYGASVSDSVRIVVVEAGKTTTGTSTTGTSTSGGSGAQAAGSLSWGVSARFAAYVTCEGKENYGMSHCAKGSISTDGVGSGYLFPQSSAGSWNRATQTGTVSYGGSVSFSGYGTTLFTVVNPSITVEDGSNATLRTGNTSSYGMASYRLDLASGTKSVGANGEVTWSNVPVLGSIGSEGAGGSGNQSVGLDPLTFTVGAEANVSYGSTWSGAAEKPKRTPAASPPATTGITVLTDAEKLKAGGRIEIEASGFEPGEEGILVVVYSDPVVLDEEAKADASGTVRWSGTLPAELQGKHTITLQGSANAGAIIDIRAKSATEKSTEQAGRAAVADRELEADRVAAAGVAPAVAARGGLSLWEWWASALGLVAIACCTTLLAVRQRRATG
ncbi:MAG: HtaA domain-containing protein [Leucobacter sp.]